MGHISLKHSHEQLRQRIGGNAIGAPYHPALMEILKMLFSAEEAEIAVKVPYGFSSTAKLAKILKVRSDVLQPKLDRMADKGLLFDVERNGKSYWYLNPLVIGFFEFSMMRIRTDVDQKELAHQMYQYMFEDPSMAFMREVGLGGETQLFRPLVHESALPDDYVEVLDYERASHLISEAGAWTVGLCHCRHVAHHRGKDCTKSPGLSEPMEVCLSMGEPAQYFARRGMGRAIEKSEAMDLLVRSREAGLVQLGDNVKRKPTFICNCCGCCCELLEGYRRLRETPFLQTSNYSVEVNHAGCTRCGACVKACPVVAMSLGLNTSQPVASPARLSAAKAGQRVEVDDKFCLGCGVCATTCPKKAITMVPRPVRVHTPEATLEKVLLMALERGKLQNLLFADSTNVAHTTLRRFTKVLLGLPPAKLLLAKKQLKSRFVTLLLDQAGKRPGANL